MIEHRADVRLGLAADSLAELLQAGLDGLNAILKPGFCDRAGAGTLPLRRSIRLDAPDATALLVDFLSEVLTHAHIDHAIYCRAELRLRGETGLDAELSGAPVDRLDEDVKAVTYHEADVRHDPAADWTTTLVLDI
jgi:SHS2 domain-containing protein